MPRFGFCVLNTNASEDPHRPGGNGGSFGRDGCATAAGFCNAAAGLRSVPMATARALFFFGRRFGGGGGSSEGSP